MQCPAPKQQKKKGVRRTERKKEEERNKQKSTVTNRYTELYGAADCLPAHSYCLCGRVPCYTCDAKQALLALCVCGFYAHCLTADHLDSLHTALRLTIVDSVYTALWLTIVDSVRTALWLTIMDSVHTAL